MLIFFSSTLVPRLHGDSGSLLPSLAPSTGPRVNGKAGLGTLGGPALDANV